MIGTECRISGTGRTVTSMSDLISRQWLMECVNEGWIKFDTEKDENKFIHLVRDIAPSAHGGCDEWCTGCKEYDQQKHSCPRWNRVIRQTVEELKKEQAEIIHCRDCKHYEFSDNRVFGFPEKRCGWCGFEDVDDDDFCSRAERREE